jgi:hypothetical protein
MACPFMAGVGALGAVLLGEDDQGEVGVDFGGAKAGIGVSLVSAKEERDLAALLDLFALGVGDVEEFQDRLQAELAALEVPKVLLITATLQQRHHIANGAGEM